MTSVLMRRARNTRAMCTQNEGHMRTQPEGGHQQAKKRGHRRETTCQPLDLGLLISKTLREEISVVKPPSV